MASLPGTDLDRVWLAWQFSFGPRRLLRRTFFSAQWLVRRMKQSILWAAMTGSLVIAACAGGPAVSGGGTASTPDAGADAGTSGAGTGLPCDVAQVLSSKCASCHGSGAQAPSLVTYADLTTGNVADRVLARMQDTASPMPPSYAGTSSAADIATIQAWVTAGKLAGSCGDVDAGPATPAPTTCASNASWTRGNRGSEDMNPGRACLQCHNSSVDGPVTRYMGTAFPALHEKDLCNARAPVGATVEILNAAGTVVDTLPVSPISGNFFSLRTGSAGSYRARVMVNGAKVSEMVGLQTNGDCNTCHTEQGTQGAPGRIIY